MWFFLKYQPSFVTEPNEKNAQKWDILLLVKTKKRVKVIFSHPNLVQIIGKSGPCQIYAKNGKKSFSPNFQDTSENKSKVFPNFQERCGNKWFDTFSYPSKGEPEEELPYPAALLLFSPHQNHNRHRLQNHRRYRGIFL